MPAGIPAEGDGVRRGDAAGSVRYSATPFIVFGQDEIPGISSDA